MTKEEMIAYARAELKAAYDRMEKIGLTEKTRYIIVLEMAIKALEQEPVLDKIRAELIEEKEYAYADFDKYKEDIIHAEADELPDDDFRYGLERAVEIIDKYKAESEET